MQQNLASQRIGSVDRALTLLTLLGAQESLTVTEAARSLDVVPSTAHRLLSTLVARGFAVQDSRRRYAAGPALLEPGQARPTPSLAQRVRPYLEQLFAATNETCHLVVLAGTDIRFVDGIEGTQTLRVGLRTGMRMQAHTTSGGKAMLAEIAPADRGSSDVRRMTTEPTIWLGINRNETEPGVTAIGASVGAIDGDHAALTIAVPSARLTPERADDLAYMLAEICADVRRELATRSTR